MSKNKTDNWTVNRIYELLDEIDRFVSGNVITNSIREIIIFNTNEIKNRLEEVRRINKENK